MVVRIGPSRSASRPPSRPPIPDADVAGLPADTRRLLVLLASGRSVGRAAREVPVSTATAHRRLEDLRVRWGCPNNIALLAQAARRGVV